MKRLLIVLVLALGLLGTATPAMAIHVGCAQEATQRTDAADFGCSQMPPPPVDPPGRS